MGHSHPASTVNGRRTTQFSHPSRQARGLDGAQLIEGEFGVKLVTGPPADSTMNGFQTDGETDYVLGPSGEQAAEVAVNADHSVTWLHTNVWANGVLIATYDTNGLHFYLNDPLGTRRVQTDYSGVVEQTCQSLPYGDGETCSPTPTEHLFTGKERDSESGNDHFGARYYASTMGRFLSPDWSAKIEPVPYAKLSDPQSLNLYAYVRNNPLSLTDADGHGWWSDYWQKVGNNLKYGEFVTNAQLPAAFASERSWLIQNAAVNQAEVTALQDASNQQINQLFTNYRGQIANATGHFGDVLAVDPRNYSLVAGSLAAYMGGKTSGILRTANGDFELQSGYDGPAASIPKGTRGFDLITKSHVEGHASAIMRQQGISEGTLEINNPEICSSCMRLLPRMLPPGATLTVKPGEGEPVTFEGLP